MAKQATVAPKFENILDRPSEDAERPKPLPQGGYVCIVQGLPNYGKSSKKQTDFVEFTLQPVEAMKDVDEDALEEVGGLMNKTLRTTYYLTENSEWRLKDFLDHCGTPSRDERNRKLSHRERGEMAQGQSVIAYVKHTASQDGTGVFATVTGTASIE